MSNSAKAAVSEAIRYAENFSEMLQPRLRRDIALGRVTMWARVQDSDLAAKLSLSKTVVLMGDAICAHYSSLCH
jgi:hypothetical protein